MGEFRPQEGNFSVGDSRIAVVTVVAVVVVVIVVLTTPLLLIKSFINTVAFTNPTYSAKNLSAIIIYLLYISIFSFILIISKCIKNGITNTMLFCANILEKNEELLSALNFDNIGATEYLNETLDIYTDLGKEFLYFEDTSTDNQQAKKKSEFKSIL